MSVQLKWKHQEGEPKKGPHVDNLKNLNAAREFYKSHFFSTDWNFSMTKSSETENVIIWIWWTPPRESKKAKIAYPITTHQPMNDFITELENSYDSIYKEARDYYDKVNSLI